MDSELVLCIPGPWRTSKDLARSIDSQTQGSFAFAHDALRSEQDRDGVLADFVTRDSQLGGAFKVASQGRFSSVLLEQITEHEGVVYLHLPILISNQRKRLRLFTDAIRHSGGLAVKI